MLNKILTFLGLKKPVITGKPYLVLYDADQVPLKSLKSLHSKFDHSKTESIWVSANKLMKNPKLTGLDFFKVQSIAKEAVDVAMVALAVDKINKNKELKEIHLFSSDADTLGTAITIGILYPDKKFFVYAFAGKPKAKRLIRDLPKNVVYLTIRQ